MLPVEGQSINASDERIRLCREIQPNVPLPATTKRPSELVQQNGVELQNNFFLSPESDRLRISPKLDGGGGWRGSASLICGERSLHLHRDVETVSSLVRPLRVSNPQPQNVTDSLSCSSKRSHGRTTTGLSSDDFDENEGDAAAEDVLDPILLFVRV